MSIAVAEKASTKKPLREGQVKRLGIEEEDVPALVKEIRRDTPARDR